MKKLLLIFLLALACFAEAQSFSGQSSGDIFIVPPYRLCFGVDNGHNVCIVQSANGIATVTGTLAGAGGVAGTPNQLVVSGATISFANPAIFPGPVVAGGNGGTAPTILIPPDPLGLCSYGGLNSELQLCDLNGSLVLSNGAFNVSVVAYPTAGAAPANGTVPTQTSSGIQMQIPAVTENNGISCANGGSCTVQPLLCADSSGSGTSQTCNTNPLFTVTPDSCVIYSTSTPNSGASLQVNINALGAKPVAKWQTTTTLSANDIRANTAVQLCYDGTNWEADAIGNAPAGSSPTLNNVGGSAAQATGTEAAAGDNYTFAGVETSALTSPFVIQNSNSTNNNTSLALIINHAGTSTGGFPLLLNTAGTGALFEAFKNSTITNGAASGGTLEGELDASGDWYGLNFGGTSNTANVTFCGGNAASACASQSVGGLVGGATFQGMDNSSTAAGAKAGYAIFRGGFLSSTTPNSAALEGAGEFVNGYMKGTAIAAAGDVVCAAAAAYTVTDCSHTGPAVNIVGIATNTGTPVAVVTDGIAVVKLDAAGTIGDVICMGTTTDGQAHDNGASACATAGTTIGIIVNNAGSLTWANGVGTQATTLSTTLVAAQLHIGK